MSHFRFYAWPSTFPAFTYSISTATELKKLWNKEEDEIANIFSVGNILLIKNEYITISTIFKSITHYHLEKLVKNTEGCVYQKLLSS